MPSIACASIVKVEALVLTAALLVMTTPECVFVHVKQILFRECSSTERSQGPELHSKCQQCLHHRHICPRPEAWHKCHHA